MILFVNMNSWHSVGKDHISFLYYIRVVAFFFFMKQKTNENGMKHTLLRNCNGKLRLRLSYATPEKQEHKHNRNLRDLKYLSW